MKKVLLTILSCLYLLVTSGMQVQQHYCMGKLRSSTIGFRQAGTCGTCGMEAGNNHCCHDEVQWIKVDDDHQAAFVSGSLPAAFIMDLPSASFYFQPAITFSTSSSVVKSHPPPLLLQKRTILYSNFRI